MHSVVFFVPVTHILCSFVGNKTMLCVTVHNADAFHKDQVVRKSNLKLHSVWVIHGSLLGVMDRKRSVTPHLHLRALALNFLHCDSCAFSTQKDRKMTTLVIVTFSTVLAFLFFFSSKMDLPTLYHENSQPKEYILQNCPSTKPWCIYFPRNNSKQRTR